MASVRKRNPKDPNSPWVCEYTDASGNRRRYTPKTGLKKDADAYRRKVEGEIERGEHVAISEALTVSAACELYIRHCEDKVRDGRIGRGRHRALKQGLDKSIIPNIGKIKFSDLRSSDVEELYSRLSRAVAGGLRPVTAKQRIIFLKMVQDYCYGRGEIKTRPVDAALRQLRGIRTDDLRVFLDEDVAALLRCASVPAKLQTERAAAMVNCIVNLAAFCGLRWGEIIGLRQHNIDFNIPEIRVRDNLTAHDGLKGPKTKAGIRDVPIPAHVVDLLRSWLATHLRDHPDGLIFATATGGRLLYGSFHTWGWRRLLKRAGLEYEERPFHFHALRHYYASSLIENQVALPVVASLMGHAKVSMTLSVYAHAMTAVEKRNEIVQRVAGSIYAAAKVSGATQTRHALVST